MNTKGIDIFCSLNSETSICLNIMDEASASASASASSSSSSSILQSTGRAIDRYNPIIRDPRRITSSPSRPPINHPKPQNHQNRNRKIGFSKAKNEAKKKSSNDQKKKGIAEPIENKMVMRNGWSCTKPGDFISPPGSSRYLLGGGDQAFVDMPSDFDQKVVKFLPIEVDKSFDMETDGSCYVKSPSSQSPDQLQVVVLRVSLHCKGCERKLRKHLSRMEGVSSFNIDFAAKKVTVVGHVSPLEVVANISKVKNAKLWMPPLPTSSPSSPLSWNNLQFQKYQQPAASSTIIL